MASYRIEFKESAVRDLRKLPAGRLSQVIRRIEALSENPFPRQSIKLSGAEGAHRLRVGIYRVLYSVDRRAETIVVQHIRHRREAYRNL